MTELKFVGLDDLELDPADRLLMEKAANRHVDKLQHFVTSEELEVVVHVKAYEKTGDRQKYSVNIRVHYPGATVTSSKDDWQLPPAIREAFEAVEQQLRAKS